MIKIGIFGQYRNGKSTFAKYLMESLNDSIRMSMSELRITNVFQLAAFAKGVKESVSLKFRVPLSDIELWKNRNENYPGWTCTMRECLQIEGETARRIDPNVWIRKVMAIAYPVIVEDGRHENEAEAIAESGGYNILIFRPDMVNDDTHPSEAYIGSLIKSNFLDEQVEPIPVNHTHPLRHFHHIVVNDGGHDRLREVADMVAKDILSHMVNDAE